MFSAEFHSMYFKTISFSLSHYLSIQEEIANLLKCEPQISDVRTCVCALLEGEARGMGRRE